jgi:hypothetical protein
MDMDMDTGIRKHIQVIFILTVVFILILTVR